MITTLISVYDKTGLLDFLKQVKNVTELKLIATTSTAKYLQENGFDCGKVEDLTGFPEILDGRVKTLHPHVFAGILARSTEEDKKCLSNLKIPAIDMVIVNLYPFESKTKEKLSQKEMLEYIDIGGVSLLRAAAKNFPRVTVLSKAEQYEQIATALAKNKGQIDESLRRKLALSAFERTAAYDQAISSYLLGQSNEDENIEKHPLPVSTIINLARYQPLRYGENPHQAATWYANGYANDNHGQDFPPFGQLQGKDLSSNNIIDTYCLVKILREIGQALDKPAACIIKHNNPCGVALGNTIEDAFEKAYNTDPLSAFGGVYGFNKKVTAALAQKICEGFVEIVAAPDFETEALTIFNTKKNMRVLKLTGSLQEDPSSGQWRARDLQDFGWILEKEMEAPVDPAQFQNVTSGPLPTQDIEDIAFAWAVVKHLTSNAIFIVKNGVSLGFGIGQTSRIASVNIALEQAGKNAAGAIMASDAFFPATDSIERASQAGIAVIIQPGGSLKDKDVIKSCEQYNIKMLFTGQRCFKH
jgi:phosphoribosylaminoimidazolecarboxamide formyltransferase / IMP cyclohydrolase